MYLVLVLVVCCPDTPRLLASPTYIHAYIHAYRRGEERRGEFTCEE